MVKVRAGALVLFYISACSPVYVLKVAAIEYILFVSNYMVLATWELHFGFKIISLISLFFHIPLISK